MRNKNGTGSRGVGDIISSITIAVIFIVILILVVFTASAYQHGAKHHDASDNERAMMSYIVKAVKDSGGAEGAEVTTKDFNGSPGLVIHETGSQYEQRIYQHEGKLLQEYGRLGGEIDPSAAVEIGETKEFKASFIDGDVLEIKTDTGTSYVHTAR